MGGLIGTFYLREYSSFMEARKRWEEILRKHNTVWRSPARWYCAVLLICPLAGCATIDSLTARAPQVQMVNALTLKLWSDPWPARVGENHLFLEVNAPTRKAMVNRDVLLTYQSAKGTTTVPMRPVSGTIDIFQAVVTLDSPGDGIFSTSVQSPTKPPATAHFRLPIIQAAPAESLPIERTDQ